MKNLLGLILLLGISTASAQPIAPGYGPGWYGYPYNATNVTPYPYGYYGPGYGMGGYGYPYGGMMGGYGMGGMMGPGMMGGYGGGYGYPYGGMMGGYAPFGAPWAGYGYGFNPLLWAVVIILVAGAYLLGKRRAAGG